MNIMKRITNLPLFIILIALCGASPSCALSEEHRQPSRFLIPEGYVGWVRINYKVKEAAALPAEDGRRLYKIPATGALDTSSDVLDGWAVDEYYYYSDRGRRLIPHRSDNELIWEHNLGSRKVPGQEPTLFAEFFVGTDEEYKKYGQSLKDEELNPIVGNVKTMPASNNGMHPTANSAAFMRKT